MADRTPHGTQAIDRAADLLARVVRAGEPVTFTELADESGLARSTTSRLLAALERADLLTRDHDGGWSPGPLFDQHAARRDRAEALSEFALPTLRRLGALTGETVNLAVARGTAVVQVAQVDSTYFLGSRNWVGVEVPPHTSALGKVLYTHHVLPLPDGLLERPTERTLDRARLEHELHGIRERGFAATIDELEIGLTGIAAPVTIDGAVVAALGISGPTARLAPDLAATGAIVAQHAHDLSTRLGRRRNPHQKEGAA